MLPERAGQGNLAVTALADLSVNHQLKNPLQALQQFIVGLKQQRGRALFFVESEGRRESLLQLLHKAGIHISQFADLTAFNRSADDLGGLRSCVLQGNKVFWCSNPHFLPLSVKMEPVWSKKLANADDVNAATAGSPQ